MASFSDLVRAQRQSGKGVITSLSGAYNQMNLQRYDPRNALFSKGGLMTSLFPGLKGYQASPVSSKSPSSMISPEISGSPTALNSIARDARISARNSMALPSIARNMSQMVRIWGGTPAKYFEKAKAKEDAYEAKQGGGKRGFAGLGKSAGGGGFNIMGMLGGVGSMLGSVVGGLGSVAGSILGGIGSLLGGAASGIFGVLSSALGGMGFVGILAAGAIGFVLYQLWKGLDFSKLGGGLGDAFSGIKESISKIFGDLNGATGGSLGKFVDDVKDAFMKVTVRISSAIETATELLMKLGGAVLKDFGGYFENFFQENKGKIFALMAIGMMGPRALMTLPGAAITAIAAAVGAVTGERSIEDVKKENEMLQKDLERTRKGNGEIQYDEMGNVIGRKSAGQAASDIEQKIKANEDYIKEKQSRTSNFQSAINDFSVENLSNQYNDKVNQKMAAATGASTAPSPAGPLSGANLLDMIGAKEGGKMGYDAANKGKAGDMPGGYPGLSKLTVGQVMEMQARKEIFAAGKYQFIPKTLAGLVASGIAKPTDPFSPVVQDKLAMELINRRLKTAGSDPIRQQFELSKEFASIENPYTGSSYYAGDKAGNKSLITSNQMQMALRGGNIGSSGGNMSQMASVPTKSPGASGSGNSIAALAYDQITALDRMMGGKLMKGSTDLADMLRDITREFMNNPTFVDSSQTVNNNMPPGLASAVTGSAYNQDVTVMMSERLIIGK